MEPIMEPETNATPEPASEPTPLQKQAVKSDATARLSYELAVEGVSQLNKHWLGRIDTWPELQRDLWTALYRRSPEVRPTEEMEMRYRFNGMVAREMVGLREFRDLHATTAGNDVLATEALAILAEHAGKWADELRARLKRTKALQGNPGPGAIPLPWGLECDESLAADEVRGILRDDLDRVNREIDEIESCVKASGVETKDDGSPLTAEERLNLGRSLRGNERFRMLAEYVGRMERAARTYRESTIEPGIAEVADVELGAEITRLLPSEFLGMAEGGDLELTFLRRFVERQTLQYKLRSTEPLAHGPMIVCIDTSGSMAGHREMWAKAVALALATVCKEQRRDLHVMCWHYSVVREWSLPVGRIGLEAFTQIASQPADGGDTRFEPPLTRAADLIEQSEALGKADVVFITDGQSFVNDAWRRGYNARKEKLGFRVWGVAIDCGNASVLDSLSDDLARVSGYEDGAALEMVFGRATTHPSLTK